MILMCEEQKFTERSKEYGLSRLKIQHLVESSCITNEGKTFISTSKGTSRMSLID